MSTSALERVSPAVRRELLAVALAVLMSVAVGSALMLALGRAPGHIWWLMIENTLSSSYSIGDMLYRATAIALTGLAVAVALDAGLFDIGVEAQVTVGVLACAVVGAALPAGTPAIVALPLALLAAAGAGGALGALMAIMKITRDAHEVITGIMLIYIVGGLALLVGNEWLFQNGTTTGPAIVAGAELPQLGIGGSALNAAALLAAGSVAAVWWLRTRTTWGQALRAVGRDPQAARSVGISVARVQLYAMTAAGALAGLAATNFVLGHKHAFEEGLGRGAGLAGISAALLGRLHPAGVALAAIALGFLATGGLAVGDKVPKELTEALQGVVLLSVAVSVPLARRLLPP